MDSAAIARIDSFLDDCDAESALALQVKHQLSPAAATELKSHNATLARRGFRKQWNERKNATA